MSQASKRVYENLLINVGSGGLPTGGFHASIKQPTRQIFVDQDFSNPAIWLDLSFGTGSLLTDPILHVEPATGTESCFTGRFIYVSPLAEKEENLADRDHEVREQDQPSLADQLAARGFSPYGEETQKRSRAGKIRSTSPGEDSA